MYFVRQCKICYKLLVLIFSSLFIYFYRPGSIITNYTAVFATDVILSSSSDVVNFISTNVTETLKHAVVINGSAVEVDPGNMTEVASRNGNLSYHFSSCIEH